MSAPAWLTSLRLRLLALTLVTLVLALSGAGWWLTGLFRDEVMREFDAALVRQLDQVTARLQAGADRSPVIDTRALSDPRLDKPYSGLYWQLDRLTPVGDARESVLRSRSLWDEALNLGSDSLPDGQLHLHETAGPQGARLRVAERALQIEGAPGRWRLMMAADMQASNVAVQRFGRVLALSLAALGLLLVLAAIAQVAIGLAPLQAMQSALTRVRSGRAQRIEGRFPAEVQPLIDEFHAVLERQEASLERARTQAGNLAHALKTPLAVLTNAASQQPESALATTVNEQVQAARRHIDWHLARSRVAATHRLPGQRTPLAPALNGLLRVMQKVHTDRSIRWSAPEISPALCFAGEAQDLQEMLGNLLDNAGRAARHEVQVQAHRLDDGHLVIHVSDDGPGIADGQRESALHRGTRLDESTPGSGLGLAIVGELAQLYGGRIALGTSALGGLQATLTLPSVD
ncbi:MAG: sensor histidine kinase [Gammaproteobacteria bacterium]